MTPTHTPPEDGQKRQRTFPGRKDQIRQARRYAAACLPDHPDAALIVSELTTNTVEHTRTGQEGGTFTLTICRRPDGTALIEVTDQGGPETFGQPTCGREGGRGLTLVQALTTAWGVKGDSTGRTVWAELPPPAS
ncbi:ATP-binding protein [Thermomonospora curvata]|uniref:Putative signal transduction histidine kinase n=1 Tax=Thermomonospora curvata (strain ATCC 19995 / DSM 43183 / JCM 3096 / KCTC 9072 / NBRC 15933 / NCIMB 10081 / Henssen B9) TaxID=471852 RepID=D1A3C7_THECD|nr:ATP-binding protein [Thermomonospora curvata]ACY99897.1 putative signal transduction histidine kinase [Thermomonospora curvata DSM 43183]